MLGKGNVDSKQVKKMAENIVGHEFKSVHTADAFSLVFAFSNAQNFKTRLLLKK
jgi:Holliday junction resolvasome RuvABC endonuclease subunit